MAKSESGKSQKGEGTSKKNDGFQISSEPVVHGKIEEDAHKFEAARGGTPVPEYEDLGELPASYGEDVLYLVARDPHWLFSYWDVDWSRFPGSIMRAGERKIFLKVSCGETEETLVEIHPEARNWYVPAQKANAFYRAELGFFNSENEWQQVVQSNNALTPSDALAAESEASFATIPLHLSFQRLVEMLQTQIGPGEGIATALARLQSAGSQIAFALGSTPIWSEEQRRIAAALLGKQLDESSFSSAEIEQLLRHELREKLHSFGGSEVAAKGQWGPEVGSLFSGIGAWKPETASLFSAIGGIWRQELTSLFSAIGAFGSASAFGSAGAFGSSCAFGSAGAFSSPGILGLGAGSLSSDWWAPLASSLFSATGASWSAQPFSTQSAKGSAKTEVVLYGGTHPGAKVTINGETVKLNPDGSFYFHLQFPDGAQQHSATLRVQHGT